MRRVQARCRSAVLATSLALVGSLLGAAPAYAAQSPFNAADLRDDVVPPPDPDDDVSAEPVAPVAPGEWAPAAANPHVVVISSGVDATALPAPFQGSVSLVEDNEYPDQVGYGTWAAAAIFQVAPGAHVTSLNVYPTGKIQPNWVYAALEWVATNRTAGRPVDAVILAFPPTEYADPVSYARGDVQRRDKTLLAGEDRDLLDTMLDHPISSADGDSVGSVSGGTKRDEYQVGGATDAERTALNRLHWRTSEWQRAHGAVRTLAGHGIPVVAPAGDLGSGLQSIGGLANVAEVVTVGAAVESGTGYALTTGTSSGPSREGLAKPDLVAPVVTAAVAPAGSLLDDLPAFVPETVVAAWEGLTWAAKSVVPRAWVGSSLSSAALVATALGGLHAEGMTDVAAMRGALTAAAEPLAGVPAWRQGAGVLRRTPDRAFAESRAVVPTALSLGLSPGGGAAWTATAPVVNGAAGPPVTRLTHFSGFGPRGETITRAVDPAAAPAVTGTGGDAVTVAATSGTAQPGLYCGYTEVPLPAGLVLATEHLPTCLVQGMTFYAESRYIHNEIADNVTYELVPGIPPAADAGVAHDAFELMPLDPSHLPLYVERVEAGGCRGIYPVYPDGLDPDDETAAVNNETCAVFDSIAPGYYQTRLFTNYGAPVEWTTANGRQTDDIGAPTAYQKMSMWLLPENPVERFAGENPVAPRNDDGSGKQWADGNVVYHWDGSTNTWVLGENLDDAGLRFAYGHFKRIIGANVASRVVDLLDYDAIAAVNGFSTMTLGDLTKRPELNTLPFASDLSAWRWSKTSPTDPTAFGARFNPLYADTPASKIPSSIVRYPIKLTTPNYLMHARINVDYRITDAVLELVLKVGDEVVVRKITPQGTSLLTAPPGTTLPDHTVPWGHAEGSASLDLRLKPKGSPVGDLYLVAYPTAVRQGNQVVYHSASVDLSGMSIEYDTWNNAFWPQKGFCPTQPAVKAGALCDEEEVVTKSRSLHVLPLATNFNAKQVARGTCRTIVGTRVCEDWSVLVHSPSKDARLWDVRTGSPDPNDPERPSADVSDDLDRYGALRYQPPPDLSPEFVVKPVLNVSGALPGTLSFRQRYPFNGITNNTFWDNLVLPLGFVERHRGGLWIRIENNKHSDLVSTAEEEPDRIARRPIAARAPRGDVPVAPYVCYVPRSVTVDDPLL